MRRASVIVDTNVAIVANGVITSESLACQEACLSALEEVVNKRICLLDSEGEIISEYLGAKPHGFPQGVGDLFLVWVYDNQYNSEFCKITHVTPIPSRKRRFEEFPDDTDLEGFDPSDQKFVAVAIASEEAPPIFHATDRVWRRFEPALLKYGVHVKHLCSDSTSRV
ncbi:MAG: hypothetical protein NT023_07075 [Armatimonadetes bacterium]|nr:hypothetical protein [Armatimonadota bacterium]